MSNVSQIRERPRDMAPIGSEPFIDHDSKLLLLALWQDMVNVRDIGLPPGGNYEDALADFAAGLRDTIARFTY